MESVQADCKERNGLQFIEFDLRQHVKNSKLSLSRSAVMVFFFYLVDFSLLQLFASLCTTSDN